jgi:hypothetical protein
MEAAQTLKQISSLSRKLLSLLGKTLLLENRESLRAVAVKLDSMELEDVKKFRVIQGENELSFSKRICLWQV